MQYYVQLNIFLYVSHHFCDVCKATLRPANCCCCCPLTSYPSPKVMIHLLHNKPKKPRYLQSSLQIDLCIWLIQHSMSTLEITSNLQGQWRSKIQWTSTWAKELPHGKKACLEILSQQRKDSQFFNDKVLKKHTWIWDSILDGTRTIKATTHILSIIVQNLSEVPSIGVWYILFQFNFFQTLNVDTF